jgi:ribosomal protein S25
MKKQNKTTTEKLIDALFIHDICDEKPGKEWFTVWDIAKRYNISRSHASKKITTLLKSGAMETKRFRMIIASAPRVVPHYKVTKGISRPCKQ